MEHDVRLEAKNGTYIDVAIDIAPSGKFEEGVWRKPIWYDREDETLFLDADLTFSPNEETCFDTTDIEPPPEVLRRIGLCMSMAFNIIQGVMKECRITKIKICPA